jgi:hypothetical protein
MLPKGSLALCKSTGRKVGRPDKVTDWQSFILQRIQQLGNLVLVLK